MPSPQPVMVAAAVSVEDVRRAYYDRGDTSWAEWITEVQLSPLQLIVKNDSTGVISRVPVEVTGEDDFTFGDAVPVRIRYEDIPDDAGDEAATAAAAAAIVYASRAESRPGPAPARAATTEPAPPPAPETSAPPAPEPPSAGDPDHPDPSPEEPDVPDLTAQLRTELGLPDTATEEEILAAVQARSNPPEPTEPTTEPSTGEDTGPDGTAGDPPAAPEPTGTARAARHQLPPGVTVIDEATLAELRAQAAAGAAARARQEREDRDRLLDDAVKAGKFPPARREYWQTYYDTDPDGAKAALASLAPGLIPVEAAGYTGASPDAPTESYDEYDRLFSTPAETNTGGN